MADTGLRAVLLPKSELAGQDGPLSLRVNAGPGSGQRPEAAEKEMVGICSQGRKWTNCRGGESEKNLPWSKKGKWSQTVQVGTVT